MIATFFVSIFVWSLAIISGIFLPIGAPVRDSERKNDIDSLHAKFEEHYSQYKTYPNEKELSKGSDALPGIDPENFIDPNGKRIQSEESDYRYELFDCSATGCGSYKLNAQLEDGTNYTKEALR